MASTNKITGGSPIVTDILRDAAQSLGVYLTLEGKVENLLPSNSSDHISIASKYSHRDPVSLFNFCVIFR